MMRYTLHSIERSGQTAARVVLVDRSGDLVEAVFTINQSPIGELATPEPDVFLDCGGSAKEVRAATTTRGQFDNWIRTAQVIISPP